MTPGTIEIIGGVATVLAIAGVILNNRRLIACFYLWMVSNSLSALLHADAGMTSLLIRDLAFLALAIEGVWKWRKEPRA